MNSRLGQHKILVPTGTPGLALAHFCEASGGVLEILGRTVIARVPLPSYLGDMECKLADL
jgi:hypothetical protein